MARSSGIVEPDRESPGRVGEAYRITPGLTLEWKGGRADLAFFIGSRRMGRSYAYWRDGFLFQAPVGYYANRGAWDMAPGYEHDTAPDLNRPITKDCLYCHATGALPVDGTLNRYKAIGHGVQCARCHGDPENHDAIVNPAKLPSRLRDSVCEQCHLSGAVRVEKAGKRIEDFRPGQDLADYLQVFTAPPEKPGLLVNSHAEAIAGSRCKQESGTLWCGSCHNPHRERTDYNAVCLDCHKTPHDRGDCIRCHMAKAKARDGGHTVFTNQSLATQPRQPKFVSYFAGEPAPRDLGLALFRLGAERRDAAYLEKAWEFLRPEAAKWPDDPALCLAVAKLLEAAGKREQAIAYYRLSLSRDGNNPETLGNLARMLGNTPEARRLRERALKILPRPFP